MFLQNDGMSSVSVPTVIQTGKTLQKIRWAYIPLQTACRFCKYNIHRGRSRLRYVHSCFSCIL